MLYIECSVYTSTNSEHDNALQNKQISYSGTRVLYRHFDIDYLEYHPLYFNRKQVFVNNKKTMKIFEQDFQ